MAHHFKFLISAVASLGLTVAGAGAGQTLDWGGATLLDDFDSAGNALNDTTYTFALGTFGDQDIWSPTAANVDDWASHWMEINQADGYSSPANYTASRYQLENNLTFARGEQAYIWIYNAAEPGPTAEWGLYTNLNGAAWKIPDAADDLEKFDWRFSVADTAVSSSTAAMVPRPAN